MTWGKALTDGQCASRNGKIGPTDTIGSFSGESKSVHGDTATQLRKTGYRKCNWIKLSLSTARPTQISELLAAMTKLALIQPSKVKEWEFKFVRRVQSELSQQGSELNFQLVDHADEADVIFYVDSNKTTRDLAACRRLLQSAVQENKFVFSLSFADQPLGVLPGIYSSLESRNFDPALHLSWPHLEAPNRDIENTPLVSPEQASRLFTFSGSCSHRLRRKLFSIYDIGMHDNWKILEVKRWYDHTENEQKSYIDDILDSRFVLCPRGIASYSHRIFETILLGRVPVVIADDWVPFSFPEQDYFVRIPEAEVGNITPYLEQALEKYDIYFANLQKVKANWFAQQTRYCKVVAHFLEFHRQNQSAHDPKALLDRIKSYEFHSSNGLLPHQKLWASATALPRRGKKILDKITSGYSRMFTSSANEPCPGDK